MSSAFSRRAAAIGTPLGIRHNGESVVLYGDDGLTVTMLAIVDLDQATATASGLVDVDGRISLKTSELSKKFDPVGLVRLAVIRGQEFDLYVANPDAFGLTVFNVRRKQDEEDRTNIYDIDGEQATWHEA